MSENIGISESQLIQFRKSKKNLCLIDLRKKADFAKGHIKGSTILELNEDAILDVPRDSMIVLISYHDDQSKNLAQILRKKNYDSYYLQGGLSKWTGGLYCTNISYVGTNYP